MKTLCGGVQVFFKNVAVERVKDSCKYLLAQRNQPVLKKQRQAKLLVCKVLGPILILMLMETMKAKRTGRKPCLTLAGLLVLLCLLVRPFPESYVISDIIASGVAPTHPDGHKNGDTAGARARSKTKPPFDIWLFPPEKDIISRKIMQNGVYETEETSFVQGVAAVLQKSHNHGKNIQQFWAVDIGANVGFHSLHMAALGFDVISFEPSPDTAQLLKQSVQSNSFTEKIHVIQAAASDQKGFGRLVRHSSSPGMTILQRTSATDTTSEYASQSTGNTNNKNTLPFGLESVVGEGIPLVRPEDVLSEIIKNATSESLGLLKIDAEGHELLAFRGVNLNLFPFQYVTFEYFPELLEKAGGTEPLALLLYLQSFEYKCGTHPTDIPRHENLLVTPNDYTNWYHQVSVPQHKADSGFHVNFYCQKALLST